jgi:hypothetical protein
MFTGVFVHAGRTPVCQDDLCPASSHGSAEKFQWSGRPRASFQVPRNRTWISRRFGAFFVGGALKQVSGRRSGLLVRQKAAVDVAAVSAAKAVERFFQGKIVACGSGIARNWS